MRKIYHKLPLSIDHLQAAVLFAFQARDLELRSATPRLFDSRAENQAAAMACILSAVAYLEANINEFFANTAEHGPEAPSDIDSIAVEGLRRLGKLVAQKASVLEKYDTALALCDRPEFDRGAPPYQAVALLIRLRNALTHFTPEWQSGGGWPHEEAELAKLSKSLRRAFPENNVTEDHQPYFPYRCLGYGSSKWAVTNSIAFVKEFRARLGLGYSPTFILEAVGKL